ncbi:MAG: hypothetical protein CL917_08920 [Deltaproteobacteria bacterium]|nr:hypothetical protein [Deltaproteobacteria bacterium]
MSPEDRVRLLRLEESKLNRPSLVSISPPGVPEDDALVAASSPWVPFAAAAKLHTHVKRTAKSPDLKKSLLMGRSVMENLLLNLRILSLLITYLEEATSISLNSLPPTNRFQNIRNTMSDM